VPKEFRHNPYSKFRLRDPVKLATSEVQEFIRGKLDRVARKTRFYIKDGWAKDMNGYPDLKGFCYGTTRRLEYLVTAPIQVSIASMLVEPLLRNDLTDAERATDTFRLMATILHETAVRLNFLCGRVEIADSAEARCMVEHQGRSQKWR